MKKNYSARLFSIASRIFISLFIILLVTILILLFLRPEDDNQAGLWHEMSPERRELLSSDNNETLKQLEGIGYLGGTQLAPEVKKVTVYNKKESYPGLNFYLSGHGPEAVLMDMEGTVLHKWSYSYWKAFPETEVPESSKYAQFWRKAYLYPNGDLIAIFEGLGLIKIDKNSNLLWAYPYKVHHDLEMLKNGEFYILTRKAVMKEVGGEVVPVLEDFVSLLDSEGKVLSETSIFEILQSSPDFEKLISPTMRGDLTHTNSIRLLDGRWKDRSPALMRGNLLVSIRESNSLLILNVEKKEILWKHTGSYKMQHDSKFLNSGNLMLFDNMGGRNGFSRILEYSFPEMQIVWRYEKDDPDKFFSLTCGMADRLPNGNTLIAETDPGRVFETTPEGRIVWEFFNPERAGDENQYIATIFQINRYSQSYLPWLALPSSDEALKKDGDNKDKK